MRLRPRLFAATTGVAASSGRARPPDPSGVPMPVGNLPGWRQVFADDFHGSKLGSGWYAYHGKPGGPWGGWWDPSHVIVHGGELVLRTFSDPARCGDASCRYFDDEVSGGIQSTLSQTYGKYLIRVRTRPVRDTLFVALLWPTGNWPPEIDFAEEGGLFHTATIGATLVWGSPQSAQTRQVNVRAKESRWHTLGIEWSPGKVVYTIDGRVWGTERTPNVSSAPMRLTLQEQSDCQSTGGPSCPAPFRAREPDLDVDWAVAYAPAS